MKKGIADIERKINAIMDYEKAASQKKKDIAIRIDPAELSRLLQDLKNNLLRQN